MSEILFMEIVGWVGTVVYLIAYYLVSTKRVEGDSIPYQSMNVVAGILLVINTFYWRAYPSLGLNAAWILIGVFTMGRKWMNNRADKA